MAAAEPTIRYATRDGKPVVEVAGVWTVFSLRGIRQKIDRALKADGAAATAPQLVDASAIKRLDTAGALEILYLAGHCADPEVRTADKAHANLFAVVQKNMCAAPPERHVNWFAHWLEEVGHNTVNLFRQVLNLFDFFGEILVVF